MQELKQQVDGKQLEMQSKERIADADRKQRAHDAEQDRALKLAMAHIAASKDADTSARESLEETIALGQQLAHEAGMAAADAGHEAAMSQMEHQQSLEAGAQATAGQAALADQGQSHALEQGQQAADLTPPPEPTGATE